MKQAKNLHLDEEVIEILTIQAVKEKTTFKQYSEKLLIEKSNEISNNLIKKVQDLNLDSNCSKQIKNK